MSRGVDAGRPIAVYAELGLVTQVRVGRLVLEAGHQLDAGEGIQDCLGGNEIDVARGLAALGHPVRLAGVTGRDRLGELALALAREDGLDTGHVLRSRARTARWVTVLDSDGQLSRLAEPIPAARLRFPEGSLEQVICGCEWVVVPAADWSRPVARHAASRGRKVVLDVRTAAGLSGCHRELLDSAHLVLLATECLTVDAHDLMRRIWSRHGVDVVVATHGTAGATLAVRPLGLISWMPAPEPIRAVDPTRGGAAFSVGLLWAVATGRSWPEAIACGQHLATRTVAAHGSWAGTLAAAKLGEMLRPEWYREAAGRS
jgi:2-dehydro-3-deoxygluconokinase